MTTIGDVLAIIAALIGIGLTSWALIVSCALLCPRRVAKARIASETNARTNMGIGILMLLPVLFGVAMLGNPAIPLKAVGWIVLLAILSIGAIGATGLSYLASDTIRKMAPEMGEYPAFIRGAGFLVMASMLPILGWFVFGPCVLLASLGGGFVALTGRTVVEAPPVLDSSL